MDTPLVSIIMGVHNNETTIKRCIDSIINQTYEKWELIICDDCSSDGTYDVLKGYEKKDNRIVLIKNKKNCKLAKSLNNCLAIAKGTYVARMDADDECLSDRIERQVDFLQENPEFAVVGGAAKIFDGEKITSVRKMKAMPDKGDVIYGPVFMHPTIMMRKKAYDKLKGYTVLPRTDRGQDWDLWFRFFKAGFKGYNLQEPVLIYHESKNDFKKRTMKTAKMYTATALYGYKLLKVPFYKYVFAFKPIISVLVPYKILNKLHNK